MNCPDFDTLMMMLDGELREEQLKAVSEHVMSCSKCRKLIDSQRKLEASWRDSFVEPDDEEFRSMERSIFSRINRRWRWRTIVPAAAGIIAVLLGVKLILNNQPSLDRVTDLSRTERMEYTTDAEKSGEEQTEYLSSDDGDFENETAAESAPALGSSASLVSEDAAEETSVNGPEIDGATVVELVQPQAAVEETDNGESLRGAVGFVHETDRQITTGGAVAGSGGGSGFYNAPEESEESETTDEIIFMGAEVIPVCEEPAETYRDITLSLDADTTGLETATTVTLTASATEETEDNRISHQSTESYSRFDDLYGDDFETPDGEVYVELAFDASGIPDSITALLLDSLFIDWSDYIPFHCRDTVLIVPLAGVQDLLMNENNVPAETIE
ncbi:MAG: hypothetical protein K8S15_01610 [Candidatus Aegiribacteria sp.]|nr:hypothetical protein [Candidatus Aegiribacteria sp.]